MSVAGIVSMLPRARSTPRLVIVGGGFTGCYVAKRLERQFDVTLVDTKTYFEFTPSVLRVLTSPNHLNSIQIAHSRYLDLSCTTVLHERATRLASANCVELSNGVRLDFDYLVLAAGSSYHLPIKADASKHVFAASRGSTLSSAFRAVLGAERVLVIGGGIVGVELAAELVERFPDKHVSLVHSGSALMSAALNMPPRVAQYCEQQLRRMGVHVVLNQRIVDADEPSDSQGTAKRRLRVFHSEKGEQFASHMTFICTGIRPNSELLRDSSNEAFRSALDAKHYCIVDKHMRLRNFEHIFCGGDLANIVEEKLAQTAEKHAEVIVKNLLASRANRPLSAVYQSVTRPIIVSLGRADGAFFWGQWSMLGFFPALMKEVVEFKVLTAYRWRSRALNWEASRETASTTKLV